MNKLQMDVITMCDYEMCPTIKSNNDAYVTIVVKSDGGSQSVNGRVGHSFEPVENRAIGGSYL